jgi:hypothetical protein
LRCNGEARHADLAIGHRRILDALAVRRTRGVHNIIERRTHASQERRRLRLRDHGSRRDPLSSPTAPRYADRKARQAHLTVDDRRILDAVTLRRTRGVRNVVERGAEGSERVRICREPEIGSLDGAI